MLALLKLIQSIIKTLHSAGTPGQVAAGMALGSALGLTPLVNLHNLVIFSLLVLLNVSFGGGMLGWMLFVPVGFLLDPLFDKIGLSLVADKVEPVKRQIASVQTEATGRVQTEKQRVDEVEKQLNAELKRLTGGLAPGIELPKIKL